MVSQGGGHPASATHEKHCKEKVAVFKLVVDTIEPMKSAYEIAMERLNKTAPTTKLTPKQKKELAELDSRYAAKIAEREIALNTEITRAADDLEQAGSLRDQLANERKKLLAELEDKKEQVRRA
jgi:hypothetical protein